MNTQLHQWRMLDTPIMSPPWPKEEPAVCECDEHSNLLRISYKGSDLWTTRAMYERVLSQSCRIDHRQQGNAIRIHYFVAEDSASDNTPLTIIDEKQIQPAPMSFNRMIRALDDFASLRRVLDEFNRKRDHNGLVRIYFRIWTEATPRGDLVAGYDLTATLDDANLTLLNVQYGGLISTADPLRHNWYLYAVPFRISGQRHGSKREILVPSWAFMPIYESEPYLFPQASAS